MQIQSREIPTCNPDILEVGIHAQSKIAGQSPGCGRPCEQLDIRLIFNREADNHWYLKRLVNGTCRWLSQHTGGVADVLVEHVGLEV